MGLLTVSGEPLDWDETDRLVVLVRRYGIEQFINLYRWNRNRTGDPPLWGDETEYMIIQMDHVGRTARLSLRAHEVIYALGRDEVAGRHIQCLWRPEYGLYMVESAPARPYGPDIRGLVNVEENMRQRRREAARKLRADETLFTISNFPRFGCPPFTSPEYPLQPELGAGSAIARSMYVPDEVIYLEHPRFRALTRNIRLRRGGPVQIEVPIFREKVTGNQARGDGRGGVGSYSGGLGGDGSYGGSHGSVGSYGNGADSYDDGRGGVGSCSGGRSRPGYVHMDATAFGMGCCCLQVTMQTSCEQEARMLHDQLTPLAPILLALTAATPVYRGFLTETDCRWDVVATSVDCRTNEERGLPDESMLPWLANDNSRRHRQAELVPRSRYSSTSSYLSSDAERYNDVPVPGDSESYDRLRRAGIDHQMARHVAHLFIRDPLVVFYQQVWRGGYNHVEANTDLFECMQSTNWQTVRYKPPPSHRSPDIGWRVEFRPCEVQFTDFENAAFVSFIYLLSRAIIHYQLNFLVPISVVDTNMRVAQRRSAVLTERFAFRERCGVDASGCLNYASSAMPMFMTIDEIINGRPGAFPGLVPIVRLYLADTELDADVHSTANRYLRLVADRASGRLPTPAEWIRRFIRRHADYKQDSIVTDLIQYDLLVAVDAVRTGRVHCPLLLGDRRRFNMTDVNDTDDVYDSATDTAATSTVTTSKAARGKTVTEKKAIGKVATDKTATSKATTCKAVTNTATANTNNDEDNDQPPPLPPPPSPLVRKMLTRHHRSRTV